MRTCVLTVAVFLTSLGCLYLAEGARSKRDVFQLGSLVRKVAKIDPFELLGYGCYCGLGGYGTPLDDIDKCCQEHDSCYNNGRNGCGDFRFLRYSFTCDGEECQLRGSQDRCQNEALQCDLNIAKCIKASWKNYNKGYLHVRKDLCKEGE